MCRSRRHGESPRRREGAAGFPPRRLPPCPNYSPPTRLLPEPPAVLDGVDERLDHLGAAVVAPELFELREPEPPPGEVHVGGRVGVAPEVAVELHQHEGSV